MQTIYLHLPSRARPRVIDITPLPWWRRLGRAALALITFLVAVPLLWLAGAMFGAMLLAGAFAILAYHTLAQRLPSRRGARSRTDRDGG